MYVNSSFLEWLSEILKSGLKSRLYIVLNLACNVGNIYITANEFLINCPINQILDISLIKFAVLLVFFGVFGVQYIYDVIGRNHRHVTILPCGHETMSYHLM